jgi:hypothetical protein
MIKCESEVLFTVVLVQWRCNVEIYPGLGHLFCC